jgi:hypothetical protein
LGWWFGHAGAGLIRGCLHGGQLHAVFAKRSWCACACARERGTENACPGRRPRPPLS